MKKFFALLICCMATLSLCAKDVEDFTVKNFWAAAYADVEEILEKTAGGQFSKEVLDGTLNQILYFFEQDVEDVLYVSMSEQFDYFVVETDAKEAIFVERLKKAYPNDYTVSQNDGLTFHWIPGEKTGTGNRIGFAYLDEDAVVMTEEISLATFLEARKNGFINPFKSINFGDDKLVKFLVNIENIPAEMTQEIPLFNAIIAKIKRISGSVDLVGSKDRALVIETDTLCVDAQAAAQLQIQAQGVMMMFIMSLAQQDATLGQLIQKSIKFEASGEILSINGNFDAATIKTLYKTFETSIQIKQ